ncbi:hypothetical protein BU16DRAFT_527617 [Lophium mytilinum]|uniref:Uncharacterized protein n=1 Tax=Lophium mytilinum TaxID=390894 RepID=A0A6A6QPY9_9PEZI|nr:hypothetical protein BU16DRAFT_527617 [Lophium mytilinum]
MIGSQLASQRSSQTVVTGDNGKDAPSVSDFIVRTPTKSSSKVRSLSDSTPQLSPSPKFREPARSSKDDHTIITSPKTPRRPDFLSRGLSLQMPPRDSGMPSPASFANRVPLSPQLDSRNTYASPASVLPRRSRGAEFSRACTNLHHSTLAEQSSPDSSPTITQKGMMIPSRNRRSNSLVMDSPNMHATSVWGLTGNGDRTAASSSVGSINMLGSESSSSDSDDDAMDPDDNDDPMLMTPHVLKSNNSGAPFGGVSAPSPGSTWTSNLFSPGGAPTFLSIQRARLRKGRSRKSSSSASGHSSMASPGPASPPNGKAFEGNGYFAREAVIRSAGSRRESLSMFTNDLHISSGNDSGDEGIGPTTPSTPGVVRRAVTRRGNLLPKTRQFGRIRAELGEESAPIDSEVRREAEIIRQVRESDEYERVQSAQSSPNLLPAVPGLDGPLEGVPEEGSEGDMNLDSSSTTATKGLFGAFNVGLPTNSGGRNFWSNFEPQSQAHTPPPPFFPRASSSAVSDDINMDSPSVSSASTSLPSTSVAGAQPGKDRSSTPQPLAPPTAADGLKKSNKRRRDDDLDMNSIKRRAVSPSFSVHNSPILSQSPGQRDNGIWSTAQKPSREGSVSGTGTSNGASTGHAAGERSNSGGSLASATPNLGPKRIGLQGMTDTNDGLMKMSIE